MRRVWSLLAVGGLGCVQTQDAAVAPASPAPISASVLPGATPAPGEPLALVAGGLLASPMVMPMWLDLRADAQQNAQVFQATEALALPLDAQQVYLEQSNDLCVSCSPRVACRVLDAEKNTLREPASCLAGPAGRQRQIMPLGGGWYAVHARDDQGSQVALLAWSVDAIARTLLDLDLGAHGQVEVTREGEKSLLLRSSCPLPDGCAQARVSPDEKVFTYRFTELAGLRVARLTPRSSRASLRGAPAAG